MSLEPLKRFVGCIGWSLGARGVLALLGLALFHSSLAGLQFSPLGSSEAIYLIMRWGMGFAGPVLATVLAWQTVQIRSTQSATGILYIAFALVLFGELASLIGSTGGEFIG
jgi:hypothetical protein